MKTIVLVPLNVMRIIAGIVKLIIKIKGWCCWQNRQASNQPSKKTKH
jgi:hypothetical protein